MNLPAQPKSVSKEALLERESRWTVFAGAAAIVGVAIILISLGESAASVRTGEGLADRLVEISSDSTGLILASIAQGIGWLLLGIPLVFMFKAASGRSDRMRRGLIGVVVAAPIFLAIGAILSTAAVISAADDFADNSPARIEACVEKELDRKSGAAQSDKAQGDRGGGKSDQGEEAGEVEAAEQDCRSEVARDTRLSSSVSGLETGFGLAGVIAFTIGMAYVALWSLRTGLLGRFWGSLGIALGAVFVLFTIFSLVWFIYLGLLLIGWVPGGRPPAWASGEAMPWQKGPGRGGGPDEGDGKQPLPSHPDAIDGSGQPVEAPEAPSAPELPDAPGPEPRKRKRRDTD